MAIFFSWGPPGLLLKSQGNERISSEDMKQQLGSQTTLHNKTDSLQEPQ